jgi:hypothetical protein
MSMRLFFSGLIIGIAIGLMVGGAIVKISEDGSGKREYPQGIALVLAIVGGAGVGSVLRRSAIRPPG